MMHKRTLGDRFWKMWSAIAVSSLGDGIFSVALPLLALQYSRSPLTISGVVIAGQIPVVIAALPVGTLADRLNRRQMIVVIEAARCSLLAVFATLVLLHHATLLMIFGAAFVLGALNIAFDVVGNACVPSMVRNENLVKANAHLLNAELTAQNLIGQALGGALMAASRALPFAADAITRVVSVMFLNSSVPNNEPAETDTSAWNDLTDGLRWYIGNPLLRLLTAVIASLAFCQGIVLGLLALYARESLHLGGSGYGLFLAVASIGTVFGGIFANRVHQRFGSGSTLIIAGVVFGAAYPVLAITHSPLVAVSAIFVQEAAVIVGSTAARSLRQRSVPEHMQGRAASANSLITLSCYPLGGLLGGLVAGATGVRGAFITAAILQAAFLGYTGPRLLARIRANRVRTHITAIRQGLRTVPVIDLVDQGDVAAARVEPPAQVAG